MHTDIAFSSVAFRLFDALLSFRAQIEDLYCGSPTHLDGCQCPNPLRAYGPPTFFCEKPFCSRYNRGYPTRLSRDQHRLTHQRDYKCSDSDCFYSKQGFFTQAALKSHQTANHSRADSRSEHTSTEGLTSTALPELGDDDLALVLKDAIIHSDTDTIRTLLEFRPDLTKVVEVNFHKRESPNYKRYGQNEESFGYCLCLAAWNSTPEALELLVENSSVYITGVAHDRLLVNALATAIETNNRPNIKYLLSCDPNLVQIEMLIPKYFEKIIRNKQRLGPSGMLYDNKDIASLSLSLWDPDLMEFLTKECNFVIPRHYGGLFSRPCIQGLSLEQVRGRFQQMRKYLTNPHAFDNGVYDAATSGSPSGLRICLENHGNPDSELGSDWNALGQAYENRSKVRIEMMRLLLEHGANPVPLGSGGRPINNYKRKFELSTGMLWDDFVQKARSGEDLEMVLPQKFR